jgi:hypothetical protein
MVCYKNKKVSLENVLKSDSKYLISMIKNDLDKPKLRSGAEARVTTLRIISELLENQNRKLDQLQGLILGVKK